MYKLTNLETDTHVSYGVMLNNLSLAVTSQTASNYALSLQLLKRVQRAKKICCL